MEQEAYSESNKGKEMSYQFFHHRIGIRWFEKPLPRGGTTFCVEELSVDALEHLRKAIGITVKLRVGIARCSEEDNYNKKIGRQISQHRAKLPTGLRTYLVEQITDYGDESRGLTLREENGDSILVFKNSKNSKKVRLVEVYAREA